jgi:bla regulator protein BlaR1
MDTRKRASPPGAGYTPLNLALLGLLSTAVVLFTSLIAQSMDPVGILHPFLPQEAQLRMVESDDLNGDQIPEFIASYKVESLQHNEVGVIVVQQRDGRWEKLWGSNISWGNSALEGSYDLRVEAADLTADGLPEVLIHRLIGCSAGNELEVYGWRDDTMKKLASVGYHKLDWLPPKQGKTGLAVWQKDIGMAFIVRTLRLGKRGWVNADEEYPEYFRDVVAPYYQQQVKEAPGARYNWYYLAEAQVKAKMPEDALQAIAQGLALNIDYPGTDEFEQLKEQALQQLRR